MAKAKVSRLEVNRKVRTILQRNGVNLNVIQASFIGRNVQLYGILTKDSGASFSAQQVETMVQEMISLPDVSGVIGNLTNWNIGGGSPSPKGDKKSGAKGPPSS